MKNNNKLRTREESIEFWSNGEFNHYSAEEWINDYENLFNCNSAILECDFNKNTKHILNQVIIYGAIQIKKYEKKISDLKIWNEFLTSSCLSIRERADIRFAEYKKEIEELKSKLEAFENTTDTKDSIEKVEE